MKFIILGEFLSLKILLQLSVQGKHSCTAKIVKIIKIKFRNIKKNFNLETWYNQTKAFYHSALDHKILTKFVKIIYLKTNC